VWSALIVAPRDSYEISSAPRDFDDSGRSRLRAKADCATISLGRPVLWCPAHYSITLLTAREREVVTLVAAGMSNRNIAARLSVSVRTVEGHLYNAMNKTGTANRDELAALLPKRRPQSPN